MRARLVGGFLCGLGLFTQAASATDNNKYSYDALGRVISACSSKTGKKTTYTYDATGNRTSVVTTVESCGGSSPPGPNSPPNAVGDSLTVYANSPTYFDPRGNDTDADGDPLTITAAVAEPGTTVSIIGGTQLRITASDCCGGFAPTTEDTERQSTEGGIDPQPNLFLGGGVTYTISDGRGGTDQAYISILVR